MNCNDCHKEFADLEEVVYIDGYFVCKDCAVDYRFESDLKRFNKRKLRSKMIQQTIKENYDALKKLND